nr:reverse transcriptase domain-containing protein [Tanacetum cinerariifolium]
MLKFQIFQRLYFDISLADALLYMLKFASTFKSLLSNKEKLFKLANTLLNENCSAVLLKKLPEKLGDPGKFLIPCDFLELDECLALADLGASINLMPVSVWKKLSPPKLTFTRMILELANQLVAIPTGVAEDVFVKVRKFYFLADFVVVNYDVDPRVPLILGRPFLRTARALIDVHGEELPLRVNDKVVTFKVRHTLRYSRNSYDETAHQVNVIDVACDVYAQEVLGFLDRGDILYLEKLLNEDPSPNLPLSVGESRSLYAKKGGMTVIENEDNELIPTRCMMDIFHDMIEETMEVFMDNFSVFRDSFSSCLSHLDKMLKRCKDTNLVLNYEKCHFMVKEGIVLGHNISKAGIEVDRAKVNVIAKLPHPTPIKGVRSFLGHNGFYRQFIQDFSKIAQPMIHLLEEETLFILSKECIQVFDILKKKLTEAPILVAPDWDLPFEIMCDASDYVVGAVLGQRKTKHFQPIHYVSKTMTDAQAHYTKTKKELLAVVYTFEKFCPYLVLSKTIVYTDHSALKYILAKQDAKPRLLWWILLLQEFDVIIRDKKGAENLTADHLSRLENPHQGDLEKKEINETFPLETLGMVASRSDSSTSWFADIANYHARNFVVKGMSSQQKKKFFKDVKHYFWDNP